MLINDHKTSENVSFRLLETTTIKSMCVKNCLHSFSFIFPSFIFAAVAAAASSSYFFFKTYIGPVSHYLSLYFLCHCLLFSLFCILLTLSILVKIQITLAHHSFLLCVHVLRFFVCRLFFRVLFNASFLKCFSLKKYFVLLCYCRYRCRCTVLCLFRHLVFKALHLFSSYNSMSIHTSKFSVMCWLFTYAFFVFTSELIQSRIHSHVQICMHIICIRLHRVTFTFTCNINSSKSMANKTLTINLCDTMQEGDRKRSTILHKSK